MNEVRPMSDRRFLVVLCACFAVVIGSATALLSLLALGDPVEVTAEGGRVDMTRTLVATSITGAALVVAGAASAVALVRAQLRG